MSLEVLDDLDGVGDGGTSGIEVDEVLLLVEQLLAGVGSIAERSAADSDSDLVGFSSLGLLQDLLVLADRIVPWHILLIMTSSGY